MNLKENWWKILIAIVIIIAIALVKKMETILYPRKRRLFVYNQFIGFVCSE